MAKNINNRPVSKDRVDAIARDIIAGKWIYDANPIRFDTEGVLIDGQNRLQAIIKANTGVLLDVVTGLSTESRLVEGTGRPKGAGDIVGFLGYKNAASLAQVAKMCLSYDMQGTSWRNGGGAPISNNEVIAFIRDNEERLYTLIAFGKACNKRFPGLNRLQYSILCYAFSKGKHLHLVDQFFDEVTRGVNISEKSPTRVLRDKLIKYLSSPSLQIRPFHKVAMAIKAWNAYVLGKNMTTLRFSDDEEFPKPF